MRSKKIGCIVLAILLTALSIVGCGDDSPPLTYDPYQIDAPQNVRAVSSETAIQITWDPAVNARSYDVYRRTVGGSGADAQSRWIGRIDVDLTSGNLESNGGLFFNDVVGWDNQLMPGWQYEYTVVSNGPGSVSGRALPILPNHDTRSNSARARVTSRVMAQGTQLANPTATLEYLRRWGSVPGFGTPATEGKDHFILTWRRLPGVTYEIRYTVEKEHGSPDGILGGIVFIDSFDDPMGDNFTNADSLESGFFAHWGKHIIPYLFAADSTQGHDNDHEIISVEIRAIWNDAYYRPSSGVNVSLDDTSDPIPPVFDANLQLDANLGYNTNDNYAPFADVTWNKIDKPNTNYVLWRAETSWGTNVVISNWTSLNLPQEEFVDGTTEKMRVRDTSVVVGKSYAYLVVAEHGLSKKASNVDSVDIRSAFTEEAKAFMGSTAPELSPLTALSNPNGLIDRIRVNWNAAANNDISKTGTRNAVYTLYRSRVTLKDPLKPDAGNNISHVNGWTEIGKLDMSTNDYFTNTDSDIAFFYDDVSSLATRVNYAYRLVETRTINGVSVTNKARETVIVFSPFVTFVDLGITVRTANEMQAPARSIALEVSQGHYIRDLLGGTGNGIEIWRKKGTATRQEDGFEKLRDITLADLGRVLYDTPSIEGVYSYKAVAIFGGKALQNIHIARTGHDSTGSGPFFATPVLTQTTSGSRTIRIAFADNDSSERLSGAQIRVRYREDGSSDWAATETRTLAIDPDTREAFTSYNLPATPNTYNVSVGFTVGGIDHWEPTETFTVTASP